MQMKSLLIVSFLLLLAACGQKQPNLLIIHTDQQAQWTVGAYQQDNQRGPLTTPHLDQLAEHGITFTNFFTNSAVCSPSRALMMTGCYATRNGVHTNNEIMNSIPTLATVLSENGYQTAYIGKWHLSGAAKPGWAPPSFGWQDNRYMFNRGHYKKLTESAEEGPKAYPYMVMGDQHSYTTDFLTEKAIDFIRQVQKKKFALMVSYPDPHQPWAARDPYRKKYEPKDMWVPLSFNQRLNPINEWHANMVSKHQNLNRKRLKTIRAEYSGAVSLIDYNVGRLIETLTSAGKYDNTLIAFTTDHGEYMGEHGMLYKNNFFEAAYRLPFIIKLPDQSLTGSNHHIISMVDFMPGILSFLAIDLPDGIQGRDFSVVLDQDNAWVDEAYVHHSQHSGAGIFTSDYYLILHQSGEHLLYDRLKDPNELYNLSQEPDRQKVLDSLSLKVIDHHLNIETPASKWLTKTGLIPNSK